VTKRRKGYGSKGIRAGQGRNTLFYALALLISLLVILLGALDTPYLRDHLESVTYDARMSLRARYRADGATGNVAVVTIDERSIAEHGRWPWSRSLQARLINAIASGGPAVIAIDVLYSEPEGPGPDAALAEAIGGVGNVVLATAFKLEEDAGAPPPYLWDHAFVSVKGNRSMPWKDWLVRPLGVLVPPGSLASVSSLGSVLTPPDRDGVIRYEPLYVYYHDDFYPSLTLQTARMYLGIPFEDTVLLGGRGVDLGGGIIEADLEGRVLIDYYGPEGTLPYISAADVLTGRVPEDAFSGKAVLVGTSAIATYDQKVTPLSANMPGVEKNATVVENILSQSFLRRAHPALGMMITLLFCALAALPLIHLTALRGSVLSFTVVATFVALASWLFVYRGIWLVMLYPLLGMTLIISALLAGRYLLEERRARRIRRMFSSYVSPAVVTSLIENPESARLGGQNRVVTVLFADIVGFTSMSEGLKPEDIVSHLNEYFRVMTDVVFHWDGTFDKIVGDEIMAFWNAPMDQPGHAELAVRCALDMYHKLEGLHVKWRSEGRPLINIGIGINTGEVLVGNIGAEDKKLDYTIIGDHVNAGARVEELTRVFDARILMTESTASQIRPAIESARFGHMELKWRGTTKVKGKEQELGIYELIETRPDS